VPEEQVNLHVLLRFSQRIVRQGMVGTGCHGRPIDTKWTLDTICMQRLLGYMRSEAMSKSDLAYHQQVKVLHGYNVVCNHNKIKIVGVRDDATLAIPPECGASDTCDPTQ
jgi:hypothetical protein